MSSMISKTKIIFFFALKIIHCEEDLLIALSTLLICKKHSKAIYKVPQSSTIQHCHASLHSPRRERLSHTHIFTGHLQQGGREVTIYHQTKRFGLLELIKKIR